MQLRIGPFGLLFARDSGVLERRLAARETECDHGPTRRSRHLTEKLDRLIAAVVAAGACRAPARPISTAADCFVWAADPGFLEPVPRVNRVDIGLIRGVDRVRDILIDNTRRFAAGLPANNALLWGARGMGKSSLVKAVHAAINARAHRRAAAQADRDPPRGHRHAAEAAGRCSSPRRSASSCFATTCRSTMTTPPTNR